MKNKILILLFTLLAIFIWSCDEELPLGPETPTQENELEKRVPVGTVTPIIVPPLDPGNSPEGIAIDWRGRIYISNTIGKDFGEDFGDKNQILKVNSDGSHRLYATLPDHGHATGLATDIWGNVYVAFYSDDFNTNGVYRVNRRGNTKRLRGSENIARPNALTFDFKGNLYVTSSFGEGSEYGGAVWKYDKRKRKFQLFFKHLLLNGGFFDGAGALPGANGIAFYPPNKLYVANTSQNSVSCIKIDYHGKATSITEVGNDPFLLMNVDGIAVDIFENIYGVLVPSTLGPLLPPFIPPVPPLVKLNPKTGVITPIVNDNTHFDTPTSIAFGRGWGNWGSVYIANAALQYGQPPVAGPGVVKVKVGVFGLSKK